MIRYLSKGGKVLIFVRGKKSKLCHVSVRDKISRPKKEYLSLIRKHDLIRINLFKWQVDNLGSAYGDTPWSNHHFHYQHFENKLAKLAKCATLNVYMTLSCLNIEYKL